MFYSSIGRAVWNSRTVLQNLKIDHLRYWNWAIAFQNCWKLGKISICGFAKVLGVQIDRQLKFRSYVDHFTAFNPFTWNNLRCNMNRGIKLTSRLKFFNVNTNSKVVCNIHVWFDSNSSSLGRILCIVVKTVIFSEYNKFCKHVAFTLLNIPTPRTVLCNRVVIYLIAVA